MKRRDFNRALLFWAYFQNGTYRGPIFRQATHVLEESDFEGHTLLMHAAGVGSAPVFRVVHQAVASCLDKGDREVGGWVGDIDAVQRKESKLLAAVGAFFSCMIHTQNKNRTT